jgi:hypothetical protein
MSGDYWVPEANSDSFSLSSETARMRSTVQLKAYARSLGQ